MSNRTSPGVVRLGFKYIKSETVCRSFEGNVSVVTLKYNQSRRDVSSFILRMPGNSTTVQQTVLIYKSEMSRTLEM